MKKLFLTCVTLALVSAPASGLAQRDQALPPPRVVLPNIPPALPDAPDYRQDFHWLCLPGRPDPCSSPLPTTALNPNGYGSVGRSSPAPDPPVDCFYVYPTVSRDTGLNSDLVTTEERAAALSQFARFHEVCRTFAPVYRQTTLSALMAALLGQDVTANFETAYGDVRDAFRQFIASRSQGRPFVLIGHSQGSIHLQRLIREEIEDKPIARRLVSAIIPGFNTIVPEGRDVGGTFRSTPLCRRAEQTGCVVTWVSFRAESPPPPQAMFGRADFNGFGPPAPAGMTVACTNPATLGRGPAPLDSYFPAAVLAQQGAEPVTWSSEGSPPTPWLRAEGLASGECVNDGPLGYFAIRVNADPSDVRTDRIPGDVYLLGSIAPGWGLHIIDMQAAQGDLIRLVRRQSAALRGERG